MTATANRWYQYLYPDFISNDEMEWMDEALCSTVDPEAFAITRSSRRNSPEVLAALAMCQICPVLSQCARYTERYKPIGVIQAGQVFAVWWSQAERQKKVALRSHYRKSDENAG